MFEVAISCLVFTALLAYVNHRFVGLPISIGVMGIALLFSFLVLGLDMLGFGWLRAYEQSMFSTIDLSKVVMDGMLSVLLFAGALHVDLSELRSNKWPIAVLAVFGTMVSATVIGFGLWLIIGHSDVALPFAYCLVFGALISPTDPIAVMGILKSAKAPRHLEVVICGESLFNDGVGIVLFILVSAMVSTGDAPTWQGASRLMLTEAGGGIAFGLALGGVTFWLMRTIDSYEEEILITLAAVLGGYALASHLHVSGPLAMVVAGLIVGNHGRQFAMSETTRMHVDTFWGLLDSIFNAVLFMLLGVEFVLIAFPKSLVLPAASVIVLCVAARLIAVGIPTLVAGRALGLERGAWKILTWGGLRGGISVALAFSLPAGPWRDTVIALTFSVVVFSIFIQGLTIGPLVRRTVQRSIASPAPD